MNEYDAMICAHWLYIREWNWRLHRYVFFFDVVVVVFFLFLIRALCVPLFFFIMYMWASERASSCESRSFFFILSVRSRFSLSNCRINAFIGRLIVIIIVIICFLLCSFVDYFLIVIANERTNERSKWEDEK